MAKVGTTRRIPVTPVDGVDPDWDYADAFEIVLTAAGSRSAEQWGRAGLEYTWLRPAPDRTELRTFLFYERRSAATIWRILGPIHRRVAPYLLQEAASGSQRTGPTTPEA